MELKGFIKLGTPIPCLSFLARCFVVEIKSSLGGLLSSREPAASPGELPQSPDTVAVLGVKLRKACELEWGSRWLRALF